MVVGVLLTIDIAILSTWQIIDPFFLDYKRLEPYVSQYPPIINAGAFRIQLKSLCA